MATTATTTDESTLMGTLCEQGERARRAILDLLASRRIGTKDLAFYSPAEWSTRGDYGHRSVLVVVHEGADAGHALGMDKAYWTARPGFDCYAAYEAVQDALRSVGLYLEDCTIWYSAIYPG
jgi:hypothetical protein